MSPHTYIFCLTTYHVDVLCRFYLLFFFFNDTATTEIYTLSLHDALPICTALRATMKTPPAIPAPRASQTRIAVSVDVTHTSLRPFRRSLDAPPIRGCTESPLASFSVQMPRSP